MRTIRVFLPEALAVGRECALPENVIAHVVRVLRLGIDDELELFNGDGNGYQARISRQDKRQTCVRIESVAAQSRESRLNCTLLQGISRGEKMDFTLQKAVELGVTAIVPVLTERCGVQLDAQRWEKKREHWQSVVHSACEQSGRNTVPIVATVQKLDSALANVSSPCKLLLDPQAGADLRSTANADDICLLIGPEGGLSEQDIRLASSVGFIGVRLGQRILRTETAALAALSALQVLRGDF